MPTALQLIPGTLATACYPSDPQALYNEMFEKGNAQLGDFNGIIVSDTEPDPEDRDKAWIKLTSANGPPAFSMPYVWYNGYWIARNLVAPLSDERRLFVGSTDDLKTYDGGDTNAAGDASGPMWEVDANFAGRFPLGVGTVPDAGQAVSVDTDVGSGQITLAEENLPSHRHEVRVEVSDFNTADTTPYELRNVSGDVQWIAQAGTATGYTEPTGDATALNNVPASRGVYIIKRTSRIYYRA